MANKTAKAPAGKAAGKAATSKATAGKAPPKKKGGIGLKLLGFLVLVLGLLMLPTSLLLLAGMVPSLVAYIVDRDSAKTTAISVAALNLCGVLPYAIALWTGAHTMTHTRQILSNPESWAIMYAAAALGWVIVYIVPPLVAGFIVQRSEARVAELQRRQVTLREGWGNEVAGNLRELATTTPAPGGASQGPSIGLARSQT